MAYTTYIPFEDGDSAQAIREKLNALGESVNAIGDGSKNTVDSTRAPIYHAAADNTYGVGTEIIYGHVKLSESVASSSGATGGLAATPSAVKTAYDKAVEALNAVGTLKTQVQNGTVVAANATRATSAGYADSSGSCSGNAATASRVPVANVGNCRFIWDGTNLNITTG